MSIKGWRWCCGGGAVLGWVAMFAGCARPVSATQSVVLRAGVSSTFTVPGGTPFNNLGDNRLELRLHDWTLPAVQRAEVFKNRGWKVELGAANEICVTNTMDSLQDYGGTACIGLAGKSDVIIRAQRNTVLKRLNLELWEAQGSEAVAGSCGSAELGTQGNRFPCPINVVNTLSWAGAGVLNGGSVSAKIAWVKWHSTVLAERGRAPAAFDAADLADWRFEGAGADQSGRGLTMSLTGEPEFAGTPAYPPRARARTMGAPAWSDWVSLRAGHPGQLDGNLSESLNELPPLSYKWTQLTGPTSLIWSDQTVADPVIEGLAFGTYQVKLTVTDGDGVSASRELTFGAVAMDDDGVVVTNESAVDIVLGPMIAFGRNPWPWADARHQYLADFFGQELDRDFAPKWREMQAGTVSVTNGSTLVSGTGVNFREVFACNGTDYIVIRYADAQNGGLAYRGYVVQSCPSSTQVVLHEPYRSSSSASGLGYAHLVVDDWVRWTNQSSNANYYDNVLAHYAMYYRSGDERYREYARRLADYWIEHPAIDHFRSTGIIALNGAPRLRSLSGLFLRALDGKPQYWNTLRALLQADLNAVRSTGRIEDIREEAFRLQQMALGALLDPEANNRAIYTDAVSVAVASRWTPQRRQAGNWVSFFVPQGSATVTTGSMTVRGTAFSPAVCANWVLFGVGLAFDPVAYRCRYISGTEVQLDRGYAGSSGVKGFRASNLAGEGTQPFMMGIVGTMWRYVFLATGNSVAQSHASGVVQWLRDYGFRPTVKGLYYGRVFPMCEPNPEVVPECSDSGDGAAASRAFAGEVFGAISAAYLGDRDGTFREMGDRLYGANFGKPGYGGPQTQEGFYNQDLEDDGPVVQRKKAKDYGFFFGFGFTASWPAARLGGGQAENPRDVAISFDKSAIPGATQARITVWRPSGSKTVTTCANSPCGVPLDRRQGPHRSQIEYLSAAGTVLAKGRPETLRIAH